MTCCACGGAYCRCCGCTRVHRCPNVWVWWPPQPVVCAPPPAPKPRIDLNVGRAIREAREALR